MCYNICNQKERGKYKMPTYKTYENLLHYGKILADKNHETKEGSFIRITRWEYSGQIYTSVKLNGDIIAIAEEREE
jgi:hypothetical protein